MVDVKILKAYGRALFQISLAEGKLDSVCSDMKAVGEAVCGSRKIIGLLKNYSLKEEQRLSIIDTVFRDKIDPLTLKFIRFLEKKRRLAIIGQLAVYFERLYDSYMGIAKILIISAFPLTSDQIRKISEKFSAKLQKKIETDVKVDSALLGGFQILVGDMVHDYSIKHQLKLIYNKLTE